MLEQVTKVCYIGFASSWPMPTGLHRSGRRAIVGSGLIQWRIADTVLTNLGSVEQGQVTLKLNLPISGSLAL